MGRFDVLQRLGAGAHGEVLEVYDRELDASIALKRLTRLGPAGLVRLKHEFRALARIHHPSVVELYDLVEWSNDGAPPEPALCMRRVDGRDFVTALLGGRARTGAELPTADLNAEVDEEASSGAAPDFERVRRLLRQLLDGVSAIHRAGFVHADLKPSNVLVDADDAVTIVDFGIARAAADADPAADHVAGTPLYMAPELLEGPPSTQSDAYAVGTMLFEVLTGRRPFDGDAREVWRKKHHQDAPSVAVLRPEAPDDLVELCQHLLQRDPAVRWTIERAREQLGVPVEASEEPLAVFGRDELVAELSEELTRTGASAVVLVEGPSGIGKTTLLDQIVARVRERGAMVASGRCHLSESLAYKGFDPLTATIARELRTLGCDERDAAHAARLFPALAALGGPDPDFGRGAALDALQARSLALAALRRLIERLAEASNVVLVLDDAQWSDLDSVAVWRALAEPAIAGVSVLIAHRQEDRDAPALRALRGALGRAEIVALEPLADDAARSLVQQALGQTVKAATVERIVREGAGHPLLLRELARGAAPGVVGSLPTLDAALRPRLSVLGGRERELLTLVSVAGRPCERRLLARAVGEGATQVISAARGLMDASLLRAVAGGVDAVDVYHDRIREVTLAALEPQALSDVHRRLADALNGLGSVEYEARFTHEAAAGRYLDAIAFARMAAREASERFAFDHAVSLLRAALALDLGTQVVPGLRLELAAALVAAGRGAEAADEYLAEADATEGLERLDLQRCATEQLFVSGATARALDAARVVLVAVGLTLPASRFGSLLLTLWLRLLIALYGYRVHLRDASELGPMELVRIDLCETLAGGLGFVDSLRGAPFSARYTWLALRAGEPRRLGRALALDGAYAGAQGNHREADRRLALAGGVAEGIGTPDSLAPVVGLRALSQTLRGEFARALGTYEEAFALYGAEGGMASTTSHFEIDMLRQYYLITQVYLGALPELLDALPRSLASAADRGNLALAGGLRVADTSLCWLVQGRAAELRDEIAHALTWWSPEPTVLQHLLATCSLAQADLYEGRAEDAFARMNAFYPKARRSLLLRLERVRVVFHAARARASVALLAAGEGDARHALSVARDAIARIDAVRAPWAHAVARLAHGGLACAQRDEERARLAFERAHQDFEAKGMRLLAAATAERLGGLVGGDEGAALRGAARAYFEQSGVVDPRALVRCQAP